MRKRTTARELALQALYQEDLRSRMPGGAPMSAQDFDAFIDQPGLDSEVKEYARWIFEGTVASRVDLDERIAAAAANWRLNRIAPIDRCILRMGIFELLRSEKVPPKVAINEAITLAKRYSTEQSGAFVNGILDRIYGELRAAGPAQGECHNGATHRD
jgi:N utilization substance protein B